MASVVAAGSRDIPLRNVASFPESTASYFKECFGAEEYQMIREKLAMAPKYTALRVNPLTTTAKEALGHVNVALTEFNSRLLRTGRPAVSAKLHGLLQDIIVVPSALPAPGFPNPSTLPGYHAIVDRRCAEAVLRGSDIYAKGILSLSKGCKTEGSTVTILALLEQNECRVVRGSPVGDFLKNRVVFVGVGVLKMDRRLVFTGMPSGLGIEVVERWGRDAPSMNGVLPNYIFMQNLPSAIAAHALAPSENDTVIDLCAAPGGKTSHLAQLMNNKGLVVALDRSYNKVARIKQLCRRLGITIVRAFYADSTNAVLPKNSGGAPSPAGNGCAAVGEGEEAGQAEEPSAEWHNLVPDPKLCDDGPHLGLALGLTVGMAKWFPSMSARRSRPKPKALRKHNPALERCKAIKASKKKKHNSRGQKPTKLFHTVEEILGDAASRESAKRKADGDVDSVVRIRGFPAETFDKVLLDGPCSALGLRPRLAQDFTLGDLKGIKSQQESLMFTAAFLLKPGGSMVYSTCTFNPLENEVVLANTLEQYPLELIPLPEPTCRLGERGLEGHGLTSAQCNMVRRFNPHGKDDTIGFFVARFRKIDTIRSERSIERFQAYRRQARK